MVDGRRHRESGVRAWARRRPILAATLTGLLVAVGVLAALVTARGPFFFVSCDPEASLARELGRSTLVYGRDGALLATIAPEHENRPVALDQISPWLQKAIVAIEDRRFYEHDGIDYRGTLRALVANTEQGTVVQGGSTITQQLARNLYLGNEQSLGRKLTEGCLATALEREWSKERILDAYLNRVYFGNRAYGAEAAARTYYSKPAAKLTIAQAALLAGLPQSPSRLDPLSNPDGARTRRDEVLAAMVDTGAITQAQADRARRERLALAPSPAYGRQRDPYLASFIAERLTKQYGTEVLRDGGLKVYTTIDARMQRLARQAVLRTLDRRGDPAAALVSIDPRDGSVRALASVVPGRRTAFNLAVDGKRQPGSTFKTFVLAEAIRRGINPWSTKYLSAPFEGPDSGGKPWRVTTYDGTYLGRAGLAAETLESDNTAYARLTLDVGPGRVAALAHAMGIETALPEVPAIGLGAGAVSPLELAVAYATLASGGVRSEPIVVRRVVLADGTVDTDWGKPKRKRVLPARAAFEATRVLERNIEAGTGTGAAIGRPAAGKTGTTENHGDAWFAGYTPQLATVVWVGFPGKPTPMTNVHGIRVTGGTFPATIWQRFMAPALERSPAADWAVPADSVGWKRWCGRYQFAASAADARPRNGCPKGATPAEVAGAGQPVVDDGPVAPEPVATEPAPSVQPPPARPEPPAVANRSLVGELGTVTVSITPEQDGEAEVRGARYVARSWDGTPIDVGESVEVVDVDQGVLIVARPADAEQYAGEPPAVP
ncbi:MAG: transglycosylase domain-containing protein [Pseudomonadota bacterium]